MPDSDIQYLDKNNYSMVIEFLHHFNLVTHDIDINKQLFIGIQQKQRYCAIGGIEFHFPYALLRSVAVRPRDQGKGYARIICDALSKQALNKQVRDLYLLTETAEGFFSKLGFVTLDRSVVPQLIKTSSQFSKLCPDNAVVMKKQLIP